MVQATPQPKMVSKSRKAISTGLHIVNVTQCSGGSVNMGQYETSTGMKEIGNLWKTSPPRLELQN
jgi:L-asparaginase